jgi:hypothetical protein
MMSSAITKPKTTVKKSMVNAVNRAARKAHPSLAKSSAYSRLPLDRRVGLTVLMVARRRQTDLAREQTRACIDQLNETELRSLSTGSLYRLLALIRGFGLRIDQPPMLDLARNLLPQDLRGRF